MQNSILKQAKVAKQGADYMEQAAQEKNGILFGGSTLKNDKFQLQENFWSHGTEPNYIHYLKPAQ